MIENSCAKTDWFFPDAFLPSTDNGISHESVCILNTGNKDAEIEFTFYFENAEPKKGFTAKCLAQRTAHVRFDKLLDADGNPVDRCLPYAIYVKSSEAVYCQYTRVDATKPSYSLMTAMGL